MLPKPIRFSTTLLLCAGVLALAQSEPKKISPLQSMAAVKTKVTPEYPAVAKQLKIEGEVSVEALVDEAGQVEKVDIVKGNPVLTHSVVEAVKRWKFTPFQQEGKPCKAVAQLSLSFKL